MNLSIPFIQTIHSFIDKIPAHNLILFDIAVIIIIATLFAFIIRAIKQPLTPAYIAAGLLIGPLGLGLIRNQELIQGISEIGIAFLLFVAGLEMSFKKLKEVSGVSTAGGILQIIITFFIGFIIATLLAFKQIEAIYIGLIIAFSSTVIAIKLLNDKRELGSLHGRIALGILLIQDIVAILAITILASNSFAPTILAESIAKAILLILIAFTLTKTVLPKIFRFAADSSELLFLASLSYCFLFALLAYILDFSVIIGAFTAGVSLATLPYSIEIEGKIRPLRDFFAIIFFVSLGLQFTLASNILIPLTIIILAAILLKPLLITLIVKAFAYKKRTSFLTGISLAQISEFSLIIAAQGLLLGHIGQNIFSITVLAAIITFSISSYFIRYDYKIFSKLSTILSPLEKFPEHRERIEYESKSKKSIIIFGCHKMGSIFLKSLEKLKKHILVIDFDPERVKKLANKKISCIFGDLSNQEILERINWKNAKVAISTIPETEDNFLLIQHVKKANPKTLVFVTANFIEDALAFYEKGADHVILPQITGGEEADAFLKKITHKKQQLQKVKRNHIKHLKFLYSIME